MKILTLSHTAPSGYGLALEAYRLAILVENKQDILANSPEYSFDGLHHEGCQP